MSPDQVGSQLIEHGYAVVPGLIPDDLCAAVSRAALQCSSAGAVECGVSSTLPLSDAYRAFPMLLAWRPLIHLLQDLEFGKVVYAGNALIPKSATEPRRPWHQDWWGWGERVALEPEPPQVGCLVYPTGATVESGCLCVIPGSHRQGGDWVEAIRRAPAEPCDEEVLVPVKPGDVVLLDARTLHASLPNHTTSVRICCTVWYSTRFDRLSPGAQARIANGIPPWDWGGIAPPLAEARPILPYEPVVYPPWWSA